MFGGNGHRGYTNTYNHDGLYALIGRQGALCGNMNISYGKAYFTEHAVAVKANKNNETRFLYYLLGKMNLGQYSGQSAQPGLAVNRLKELSAFIPTFEEQTKIGEFLKQLDDTIALHQQKYDKLLLLKKGYLQKMLPKKDKELPSLNFVGYNLYWQNLKISEIALEAFGGGTPKTSTNEYWHGHIPWIQSSDLTEHKVSDVRVIKRITIMGLENSSTKLIPKDSIAIVTRVGVGKLSLIPFEYTTSQDFLSLSYLKADKWFSVYSLYNLLQLEHRNVQGTSIKGITKAELLNKKIKVPIDENEQIKIGKFMREIDILIKSNGLKIEMLNKIKKSFLQKMLV